MGKRGMGGEWLDVRVREVSEARLFLSERFGAFVQDGEVLLVGINSIALPAGDFADDCQAFQCAGCGLEGHAGALGPLLA